ncbi:hypothetical protein TNCV_2260171 [Trichonephila clavipes]|nr:hypothetical protein TNCV_2260171 [Trichonephila clavipes]
MTLYKAFQINKFNTVRSPIRKDMCNAGFTASVHAENEGVNELLRHCCPFRLAAPIEAPEWLLVVRYELPSVCLENPIHARWD